MAATLSRILVRLTRRGVIDPRDVPAVRAAKMTDFVVKAHNLAAAWLTSGLRLGEFCN